MQNKITMTLRAYCGLLKFCGITEETPQWQYGKYAEYAKRASTIDEIIMPDGRKVNRVILGTEHCPMEWAQMARIGLVNYPRKSPEELNSNLRWVGVKTEKGYVYQNYFDERGKYDRYARKRGIELLRRQEMKE